ncbi:MAG: NAD(P)-dependent oxidoreductase [bacterium]|nr:NAD(P)-dependent oxidoreductase [bacterium]
MKKLLITGGNGFIGKNLVEQLHNEYRIYAPSRLQLDLLDDVSVQKFLKTHRFDVIIHAAIHISNSKEVRDQEQILKNNLRMFINLYNFRQCFGKMFYFGSGAEYDKTKMPPRVKEKFFGSFIPKDDYGFSKYICAQLTENSSNIYNLRLFGCFGKYEDWRKRFISNALCKAIFNTNITLVQNVYFDYLYINDLVRIVRWFIQADKPTFRTYNVCTGQSIDLLTIAKKIVVQTKKPIVINVKKSGFKNEYTGDNKRLLKEIKRFSFTPIDTAITELFDWYRINRKLIDKKSLYIFG